MEVAPVVPIDPGEVISRLTHEVHAKEEALSMLKMKTKAFVDNMRDQLAEEKKKVSELELQLQQSAASAATAVEDGVHMQQNLSEEIERLKQEVEAAVIRENDLKKQCLTSGDESAVELETEKEKTCALTLKLQEMEAEVSSLREHEIRSQTELQAEKEKTRGLEIQLQEKLKEVETLFENESKRQMQGQVEQGRIRELESQLQERSEETATFREAELKLKSTADEMAVQVRTEQQRVQELESQLQEMSALVAQHESIPVPPAEYEEETVTLRAQCESAAQEVSSMRESLHAASEETSRLRQELDLLRTSSEQEQTILHEEVEAMQSHERELEATIRALKETQEELAERGQLDAAIKKHQELEFQLEQCKIENKHLQKQLSDKDFQLEQLEDAMMRAEEAEAKELSRRSEAATLQSQLQAKCDELANLSCSNCSELEAKLSEMTTLYEKVNMGRSRSDSLLAETQSALSELETVKRQYAEAQELRGEISRQNEQLKEKVREQDAEVSTLKDELKKWSVDMADLQSQLQELKSDSSEHRERSASAVAEHQKAEEVVMELRSRCTQLEKRNQELVASIEVISKESSEKRLKAKALVMSLASEKQNLLDTKSDLQKEVDRLRMELNQRHVENDERLKQLRDEANEKNAQSTLTIQNLGDEIASLKKTLAIVQESERSQQRAKELAMAKREVEDSHKKRLAAKAETQKLALELESVHKCLDRLSTHVIANSTESVQKISRLLGHVKDAVIILEKRAAISVQTEISQSSQKPQGNAGVEGSRGAETVDGARLGPMSPFSGAKRMEENVSQVTEQLKTLVDATERLCDLATEQGDINLKDAIISKLSQAFTQCFAEKLQSAYSKADEDESFLDAKDSKSETSDTGRAKA